jgi:glyoxylase-like metal-dependent hydrolase (beta-lactamase superfamily II)
MLDSHLGPHDTHGPARSRGSVRSAALPVAARVALAVAAASLAACSDADPPPAAPPVIAPVPDTARGVPIDYAIGYALESWGRGLYWITDGTEQAMFLVTAQGVVVLDAPPALTDKLRAAIAATTTTPITHVVYSHYHADHIGGAGRLGSGLTIVAHRDTARALERAADPSRPAPTIVFDTAYQLQVGGEVIELSYPGPSHVAGNLIAYLPRHRVAMAIDLVWPGWVPFYELGQAEDVPGYRRAIDAVLALDFDRFVGGHVGRAGTRADVETTRAYLGDLFDLAGQALGAEDPRAIGMEVGFENPWYLVDTWFGRMARRCADEVTRRWVGRLGGADVWPAGHCLVAIQSLRID